MQSAQLEPVNVEIASFGTKRSAPRTLGRTRSQPAARPSRAEPAQATGVVGTFMCTADCHRTAGERYPHIHPAKIRPNFRNRCSEGSDSANLQRSDQRI